MPDRIARPFPLMMEVEFLDRLSEPVRDGLAKSVSDLIRQALAGYDFTNVVVMHPAQVQISVRLPGEIRRNLRKVSRSRHTSVGQLVRAAVEAHLAKLEALQPAEPRTAGTKQKRRAAAKKKKAASGRKRRRQKSAL